MKVLVVDEIGYAVNTGAAFYTESPDGTKVTTPKDSPTNFNSNIFSFWGDDNMEPVRIAEDIENCGVLSAGIQSKVRMAIGKGVEPHLLYGVEKGEEKLEHILDSEVHDFMELNRSYQYSFRNIYNFLGYGWGHTQLILSRNREKINRIYATDVYEARLEKRDAKTGIINNLYLAPDWSKVNGYDTSTMARIPLLWEGHEVDQLENYTTGFEFGMLHRMLVNGRQYYPRPMHQSARAWVKISRSVPRFKEALGKNSMHIKYLVLISEVYWTRVWPNWKTMKEVDRKKIIDDKYDEINKFLAGEEQAGKSIMAGKYFDVKSKEYVPDITIEVIDDKMKDGKFLPDTAAADKQILFSMAFNPAIWGGNLLGDGASGGAGSGSDIREAFAVQLMLMHGERMLNLDAFDVVKKYNGWSKRLEKERNYTISTPTGENGAAVTTTVKITPKLVFRYKSEMLTTLDTGGSTKKVNQ